ncbi:hypothetical protein I546_0319 [Mycobacterium kansasii 732]|nr:hypothetical protein I546_0319 [Mycobacterium kansasii 732]
MTIGNRRRRKFPDRSTVAIRWSTRVVAAPKEQHAQDRRLHR